jgi:hypothetical protein
VGRERRSAFRRAFNRLWKRLCSLSQVSVSWHQAAQYFVRGYLSQHLSSMRIARRTRRPITRDAEHINPSIRGGHSSYPPAVHPGTTTYVYQQRACLALMSARRGPYHMMITASVGVQTACSHMTSPHQTSPVLSGTCCEVCFVLFAR